MLMMSMKRNTRSKLALLLLFVFLIPFVPVAPVAADPLPVQVPDFPYGQDDYYNVNNGGFALWQVHGSNYVSYVQTFSPGSIGKPDPIVIFNKTLFYGNYTYYLDVNYITDTWDIYGYHTDGFPGTQNIRVPRPLNNPEIPDSDVYATLVYCSDDVRWRNGSDTGIYMYMNYLVPGYADPTPIPTPTPGIDNKFPTFINAYKDNYLNNYNRGITKYLVVNRYYDEANLDYKYQLIIVPQLFNPFLWGSDPVFTPKYDGYDFIDNTFTAYFFNIAPNHNSTGRYHLYSFSTSNYYTVNDIYDCTNAVSGWFGFDMNETTERNYKLSISDPSMNYEATAIYLINSDGSTTRLDGDGGTTPIATPTPTAVPTAIPQPTQNPDPTATPEPDVKVVTPSDHWWDGLIRPIQYIFVPSKDKMMKTYNTFANKFGVQKPTEFHLDINALFRPDNVVLDFHPVSLDGQDAEPVEVTLIDFEMVDDWLDSAPGQMIIRIVRAVFGLLMWAYLIYIFRKHIATINYTDAATLMDEDTWKGGDD